MAPSFPAQHKGPALPGDLDPGRPHAPDLQLVHALVLEVEVGLAAVAAGPGHLWARRASVTPLPALAAGSLPHSLAGAPREGGLATFSSWLQRAHPRPAQVLHPGSQAVPPGLHSRPMRPPLPILWRAQAEEASDPPAHPDPSLRVRLQSPLTAFHPGIPFPAAPALRAHAFQPHSRSPAHCPLEGGAPTLLWEPRWHGRHTGARLLRPPRAGQ